MIFLVYSEVNSETIASNLGQSEYSYYFVLKAFLPTLRELGEVRVVTEPQREVDRLFDQACAAGKGCVFLPFTPPHKTPLGLRCPTVPLLAWEFEDIPYEHWFGDRKQDWRYALKRCGQAITHCGMTVAAIKSVMGDDYPVVSIPAPVWDRYASLRARLAEGRRASLVLNVRSGLLLDSHAESFSQILPDRAAVVAAVAAARRPQRADDHMADLPLVREQSLLRVTYRYAVEWYRLVGRDLFRDWRTQIIHRVSARPLPPARMSGRLQAQVSPWPIGEHQLELSGVVFTSLFNPCDGRKNWVDMLTAFCTAFRDRRDATLLFKLGATDYHAVVNSMLICMARMPKFACRVVLLNGYLDGDDFDALIEASDFVVNASYGEGQCLPLMEFLSCGVPAIAPRNSAMLDYMDEEIGFVVNGWREPGYWPQDPRMALRTCQERTDWESLVSAYRSAYQCIHEQPQRYAQLSTNAVERMRLHCSTEVASARLKTLLNIEE